MMNLSGLGVPALAQAHLTEGVVKQVALSDLGPAMMVTGTTVLWSLVSIVIRTYLLSVFITVSVVG